MQFSARQYNLLERAITERRRIAFYRRGSEYVATPLRVAIRDGKEWVDFIQPSTGDKMSVALDDIDQFEIVA